MAETGDVTSRHVTPSPSSTLPCHEGAAPRAIYATSLDANMLMPSSECRQHAGQFAAMPRHFAFTPPAAARHTAPLLLALPRRCRCLPRGGAIMQNDGIEYAIDMLPPFSHDADIILMRRRYGFDAARFCRYAYAYAFALPLRFHYAAAAAIWPLIFASCRCCHTFRCCLMPR